MKKFFVTFFSPGTFVAEQTVKEIDSYNVDKAVEMAQYITERHGATPYGFQFSTRSRGKNDLDSKTTNRSNMYYLGGKIETVEEIKRRNDPKESILLSNMQCNGWGRIVTNTNSYRWTQPLNDDDVVLEFQPRAPKDN